MKSICSKNKKDNNKDNKKKIRGLDGICFRGRVLALEGLSRFYCLGGILILILARV